MAKPNSAADDRGTVGTLERERLRAGVGERLAWLRRRAGMTQEQAGTLAGISPGAISKLERGTHRPTKDSLRDLAAVYAPDHPRIEFWNLCKLAGDSLRDSHRRQSPARPPISLSKAESYARDAQRAVRAAERAMPHRVENARCIAQAMLKQAERDLTIAQARDSLLKRLREAAENDGGDGQNVG
ncbi:helix-turn-helix domain-containing protein [Arthrobacter dokdonensis]|uniref:helix-turn-helix domain-containing protein n=1 Tax=Arthrobacter dokdonellae TaxID=2211210 RepID=UPI000DE5A2B1|nr:helix-turn-helix transcriptional regulator [Arthrobacter dokdonellae]